MFWNLNRSLIPNNTTVVAESLIWNILIPSHPELQDDIDDSDHNENEEDNIDDDNDIEDDVLSLVPVVSEEADYTC